MKMPISIPKNYLTIQLSLLFFVVSHTVSAQNATVTNQQLFWIRYYNQLVFNPKIAWHNEVDNRMFFKNTAQHQLFFHSHLHYRLNPSIDFAVGITYNRQSPQDPFSTKTLVIPEVRPFQEINISQSLSKKLTLTHRFRLDERFISKNDGNVLLEGSDFNFRFRYRVQLALNLSKTESKTPTTLKISDELMLNAGGNIVLNHFDQNRFYVGFEKTLSPALSLEAGYLYFFQQRNTGYDFFERDILRFTLYHRIRI